MVNFNPIDWDYIVRWQSDLENTKGRPLHKPSQVKENLSHWAELEMLRNGALKQECAVWSKFIKNSIKWTDIWYKWNLQWVIRSTKLLNFTRLSLIQTDGKQGDWWQRKSAVEHVRLHSVKDELSMHRHRKAQISTPTDSPLFKPGINVTIKCQL